MAVGHAISARARVDARNPKFAEIALAGASVTIGVLTGVIDGLLGGLP